jgi:hypothetical protein
MAMKTLPDCFRCVRTDCKFIGNSGRCGLGEIDWQDDNCLSYESMTLEYELYKASYEVWKQEHDGG